MTEFIRILKLNSGLRLLYASKERIRHNLEKSSFLDGKNMAVQSADNSDVTFGIYEGGFKIWEGAVDLCNYLDSIKMDFTGKNVLEIGCGAGLPAIYTAKKNARRIFLQDFNNCVLECFTKENIALNKIDKEKCRFIDGDWTKCIELIGEIRFDYILMAETIYDADSFEKLNQLIDKTLENNGTVLFAAKEFYFGVGGGIQGFIEFVKKEAKFEIEELWTSDSSILRKIMKMIRILS